MRDWLKNLRCKNQLTQMDMALLMEISQPSYSKIESCCRQDKLTLSSASKIAEILSITLDDVNKFEAERIEREKGEANESITNFQQP